MDFISRCICQRGHISKSRTDSRSTVCFSFLGTHGASTGKEFIRSIAGFLQFNPIDAGAHLSNMGRRVQRFLRQLVLGADPDLHDLLQGLAESAQPRRYITASRKLMDMSIDEIEAVVDALTTHKDEITAE